MTDQRILITGATGFIGRNLTEHFARQGRRVRAHRFTRPAYDAPGVEWVQADLRDPAEARRVMEGCDVVLHCAAVTSGANDIVNRPTIHVADNVHMNIGMLQAAYDLSVAHYVFFSCSIMYASSSNPQSETDFNPAAPLAPNYFAAGNTKVYFENMCRFFADQGRTKHTAIRHSNIYGPYDKFDLGRSHVFAATLRKALTATDGVLRVWGSGEEGRDLLHVDDLVAFIDAALRLQTTPYELVNVGAGHAVAVKDLAALIAEAVGGDLRIETDPSKPTIPVTIVLDATKAERLFGWRPTISLRDGVRRTLDWVRKERTQLGF